MARYEAVSEAVSLPEVRARGKQWRRLGLGAVFAGSIGAMVYSQLPERRATPMQRLARFHRSILEAFEEPLPLEEDFSVKMTEEGGDSEPSAMSIEVQLQQVQPQEDPPRPVVGVVFHSKEGRADDLAAALKDLKETTFSFVSEEFGPKALEGHDFEISVGDDDTVEVTIKFSNGGELDEGERKLSIDRRLAEEDSEGEKPKLNMKLSFGRTLQEMWASNQESCATVHGGVSLEVHTALAKRVVKELLGDDAQILPPVLLFLLTSGNAFASVSSTDAFVYRKDVLAAMAEQSGAPDLKVSSIKTALAESNMVPFMIGQKIAALEESADGLKKVTLNDGEHLELVATFTNFRITPLLKALFEKEAEN